MSNHVSSTIVRSNQNAVMFRFNDNGIVFYAIHDNALAAKGGGDTPYTYSGTLNACKKAWNRHYANSRQFVAKGNHRYMEA